MKIESITSPAFAAYSNVLEGHDTKPLLDTLNTATPLPEGVAYVPSLSTLECLPRGINEEKPDLSPLNDVDKILWARNKWLLSHPDSKKIASCRLTFLK